MKHTEESLILTQYISENINNMTFHHHYYILFDIAKEYYDNNINYLEIGCYAGGSSCLMLQRPNTNVYSIDLGKPIKKEIVINNVNKLNKYNNIYKYIQGDSKSELVVNKIKDNNIFFDIIFIDGDHSYNGVISDFEIYSKFLNKGGYIVFDDYNDKIHSPEVKLAVDDIVKNLSNYHIIGTIDNIYSARPIELKEGNCFIIKKYD